MTAVDRPNSKFSPAMDAPSAKFQCTVLVVDDEPAILGLLKDLLHDEFNVVAAGSAEEAKEILSSRSVDIVLTDQQLPTQSGVQLLEHVCLHSPQTIRILMTGMGRLEDAVDAINCGRVHRYLFKPWKSDQLLHTLRLSARQSLLERSHEQLLEELRKFNLELEKKVHQRTEELEQANRQLQQRNQMLVRLALTDPLTGLPNRRAMDRLAKTEIVRRTRYPSSIAIGFIDVDHFKDINTLHQLSGGDQALVWLAQTLVAAVRTVDTVGRVGGEEFMVVAPETDSDGAWILAERIRTTVEQSSTQFASHEIRLTVSLGIAVAPAGQQVGYDQLRHIAAEALGEAKLAGRNKSVMRVVGAETFAQK
jgi:diguanylate cyclase (GGDEF)-like protein